MNKITLIFNSSYHEMYMVKDNIEFVRYTMIITILFLKCDVRNAFFIHQWEC